MKDIILIIGASSDIGLDLIKRIDKCYSDCLILAHYNSDNINLSKLSFSVKNEMILLNADLTNEKETMHLVNEIETTYGIPNKIVHLVAASIKNIRFKDILWKDFKKDIDISLRSSVLILSKFLPKIDKNNGGKVVLMLSSYVFGIPPKALSHYVTTKYSLLGLAKSLAIEYADKNIQVNSVSPSMIDTKFLNNINERLVEMSAYNHPLKRNASVEDVTPIIMMLISKESDYINGANIPITGGSS
jgi:3-oxoacyl-[acyl-carrier protein] reductase